MSFIVAFLVSRPLLGVCEEGTGQAGTGTAADSCAQQRLALLDQISYGTAAALGHTAIMQPPRPMTSTSACGSQERALPAGKLTPRPHTCGRRAAPMHVALPRPGASLWCRARLSGAGRVTGRAPVAGALCHERGVAGAGRVVHERGAVLRVCSAPVARLERGVASLLGRGQRAQPLQTARSRHAVGVAPQRLRCPPSVGDMYCTNLSALQRAQHCRPRRALRAAASLCSRC